MQMYATDQTMHCFVRASKDVIYAKELVIVIPTVNEFAAPIAQDSKVNPKTKQLAALPLVSPGLGLIKTCKVPVGPPPPPNPQPQFRYRQGSHILDMGECS